MSEKRKGYITWDEYFMGVAKLSAMRSKDPSTQVGACIVSEDNKILSMGYNGFPKGCSDDEFPWGKGDPDDYNDKYLYVTHSELNAILNYRGGSLEGILGITYRDGSGEIRENGPQRLLSMDEIPFYYKDMAGFENRIVYYESSRGCPFSCSYCLSSIDKSVRFRSLSLVKKELDFFLERSIPWGSGSISWTMTTVSPTFILRCRRICSTRRRWK